MLCVGLKLLIDKKSQDIALTTVQYNCSSLYSNALDVWEIEEFLQPDGI